jgi:anthranilate phosphoribosyltransferase
VHGADGLDEISIAGETRVAELHDGRISEYTIKPEDFGMRTSQLSAIRVNNAEESKALLLSVLDNEPGPARDIVLMNAGAAIYAAGAAQTIAQGIEHAGEAIASGGASNKLRELRRLTNRFKN